MSRIFWTARTPSGPSGGAHDTVSALNRAPHQGTVSWILDTDIVSFFDSRSSAGRARVP